MADKSLKKQYEDELIKIMMDNTAHETEREEAERLLNASHEVDESHYRQFLAREKESISQLPTISSFPSFLDISENPKVMQKDYGFTENDAFYSADPENPKSWMSKSIHQLKANAEKYGMDLGEYLNRVQELSTQKEQMRQWKENASVKEFKNVPVVGDVSIPGYTRMMIPTSFNKAASGQEVGAGDVALDIGIDMAEAGGTVVNPLAAAFLANAARQGKQIYDETQDGYSVGEGLMAAGIGAAGSPVAMKTVGDVAKRVPIVKDIGWVKKAANGLERAAENDPVQIAREAEKRAARIQGSDALGKSNPDLKFTGKNARKAWSNPENYAPTEQEVRDANKFLSEATKGPEATISRIREVRQMPQGDVLARAWSQSPVERVLRRGGQYAQGPVGGRWGTTETEEDLKQKGKKIIQSSEWARYVLGLPNNLSERDKYIGMKYGEND